MARRAPHPFTLRQLQYALAVADLRGFRAAAEACRVAQPSLSAQVAQLEQALGVALFERAPRGVLVTEAGERLLARARRVLVACDELADAAGRAGDPFACAPRLGVIPTVAPYLLPGAAPLLRARYPALRPVWVEEKTPTLLARLDEGELDAAVLARVPGLEAFARERLGVDPFVLAAPEGHALARVKGACAEGDLEGHAVLLLDDGHCLRTQALELCARVGADEAAVRATSLSTLAQMVAGGAGVTLLPALAVPVENRAGGLVVRPFGRGGPSRELVLVFRASSPLTEALRGVAAVLREAFDAAVARPKGR